MLNLAVLIGTLSRPAERRVLPSGDHLLALDLTVRPDPGSAAESIPVVWLDPPAWAADLDAGAGVLVVGRVRRRFFKAAGATASRTEVVAEQVVRRPDGPADGAVPGAAGVELRPVLQEAAARITRLTRRRTWPASG